MSTVQQVITIATVALGTMLTRFLPFVLFRAKGQLLPKVAYLGRVLPGAVFGMLIIYCLKGVNLLAGTHGLPEIIALFITVGLHLYKRNMLLSIAAGTLCYMLMVQWIFA